MTTTVIDSRHSGKSLDTELATQLANETKLTGPAWFLHRQQAAALNRQRDPFNTAAWLEALEASHLHESDKATGRHLASSSGWYGDTTASRTELAALAGVTRVATITARTARLEAAGFITTKQRYNKPVQTTLTVPLDGDF